MENGLHHTLDMRFREDDCRMRRGNAPAVMGILHRAALEVVSAVQQDLRSCGSIGLLRGHIGLQPWSLASNLS